MTSRRRSLPPHSSRSLCLSRVILACSNGRFHRTWTAFISASAGLSSRPHGCSHAILETTENAILVLRSKHPSWEARKLKARLEKLQPRVNWPAASTFGNILNRAGLTNPKQKKRRTCPYSEPFAEVTAPNQLWCMDFKGYFSTGDSRNSHTS